MAHRILIVDEDPDDRARLFRFLSTDLGYDVETAPDGHEALDCALHRSFNLVLLDVHMPGLSGPETWMRLKKLMPDCEVIFMTPDGDLETTMDFMRFSLPRERIVVKPFVDLSQLTRLIIGILGPPTT